MSIGTRTPRDGGSRTMERDIVVSEDVADHLSFKDTFNRMKPRYNLRLQSDKVTFSTSPRITKKPEERRFTTRNNRRHSLRLTSAIKPRPIIRETPPKWRKVKNETNEETISINDENDDYDELLTRHHRRMLEEQKDRKLYERYVRGQRTLRRLQCRRTHTAHLNEVTRARLLRELERERRYTVQDQICTVLSDHTIIFRHGCYLNSNEPMTWSTLENKIPRKQHFDTIYQLDTMISNLKKVIRTSKISLSKPRLSVHERRKQRLAAATKSTTPTQSPDSNLCQSNEIHSTISSINPISQSIAIPRLPTVRFVDDPIRTSSSQHLTCIQNVLLPNNNHSRIVTNDLSTPVGIRKQFLRPKSTHANVSDSSLQTKKQRPLEKENCSQVTSTFNHLSHSNTLLKATSSIISIKPSLSYRSYPNTRKHPIHTTTRRQTRLSANV